MPPSLGPPLLLLLLLLPPPTFPWHLVCDRWWHGLMMPYHRRWHHRQLIVQLGLYPVWYKRVGVLSTGEIRKVLLAYVLSRSPQILVLEKPYDGLDAPSRLNLNMILSQLCLVSEWAMDGQGLY